MTTRPDPARSLRITLCLATALLPLALSTGARGQTAQAPEDKHGPHHRHHRHGAHGTGAGHDAVKAQVAEARARPAHDGPKGAARHSTAPERLQVVGRTHSMQASAIGSLEQALMLQKMAPNLINVMPQSEIKKVPNFVIGDALRRLPGVSVTNSGGEASSIQIRGLDPNLNGVTFEGVMLPAGSINHAGRAAPAEAFPASLAGGVVVTKSNRPDQDAYALGGQMDLLSRDIGPDDKPFLELIASGGFRDPHPTQIFNGTIDGGMRFGLDSNPFARHGGGDKPFSISFFATALADWLQMDDFQQSFATTPAGYLTNTVTKASVLYSNGHKTRWGYGGTLGWDVDKNTKLYLKAFDSGLESPALSYTMNYSLKNFAANPAGAGSLATSSNTYTVKDSLPANEERVFKFGGDSALGRFKLDYFGAYASNSHLTNENYASTYSNPRSYPVSFMPGTPPVIATTNGANLYDYTLYKLSGVSNGHQQDMDQEWTGHVGATTKLDFGAIKGVLGFGGGARFEHVTFHDPSYSYLASSLPNATAGQWAGDQHYSAFGGLYDMGYPPGTQPIRQLLAGDTFPIVENVASDIVSTKQAGLDDDERVYNLYLQYQATWRRFGLLAGVRYEKTDGVYRGTSTSITPVAPGSKTTVTTLSENAVGQEYANFFPTAQLRYNWTDNLISRANFSTALGRPGFNAVTATRTVNYATNAVTIGNPNLKPTTGMNFDVDIEYYLPHGGIVSAGAFDKQFQNYVVNYTQIVPNYPGLSGIATINTYANIKSASARGIELNYHQPFTFLPGFWKGFGIGGNFTFVDSRGKNRDGVFETLPNTTSHLYNGELFYERGRYMLQFDVNYQGLVMTGLGNTPAQDSYTQPYLNFDIGARYNVTKRVQVYFQGRNIGQEMQKSSEGSGKGAVTEMQLLGSAYLFGLDVTL
ncbi:TonB-dependent receptor [Nguyenibacter sp. L1]|uniref:TonB-dependent receptor n=1 Tax=Nguyenibacter sp. L1 TaxID=3049350 RepID=UPI002B49B2F3|nr:TonB-dependent receptor [Nguyenibacter sp. L1]WRH89345.1 TonB-dependent receptor [Nguyenibacter sp. L1]